MHKASKSVQTLLIAPVILASALLAVGCNQDDVHNYENVDSCAAAGVYTKETCKNAYEAALAQHKISAPKYESKQECETEWGDGKCETNEGSSTQPPLTQTQDATSTSTGGSGGGGVVHHYYSPWLYGYGMSGGSSGSPSVSPTYRSRSGGISSSFSSHSSGSGHSLSSKSGSSYSSSSRGGFGGTARGYSGGHSSFGG